jgi:GNAT superfamily N-acetyltransferase
MPPGPTALHRPHARNSVPGQRKHVGHAMTDVTIRAATPEDQEMLNELIAASYSTLASGAYEASRLVAAMPVMSRANPKLLACGTYYVAESGGEPAACGGWTVDRPGTGEIIEGVAHIRHFATHPNHLRKGIARMLLDRCIAEAATAGMKLMKSQATLPAEPFYAAAGFRRVGLIEVKMGDATLPAVDMERPLP